MKTRLTSFHTKPRKPLARTGFKKVPAGAQIGLRRATLQKKSKSEVTQCKDRIQALLRQIVMKRDGGCVLRHFLDRMPSRFVTCNDVLQAEHLNTRSHSVSYGDTRNVVCLCSKHHIQFKPQHSQLYWEMIEEHLKGEKWDWYKRARDDHRTYRFTLWDWNKVEMGLQKELETYTQD